MARTMRTLPACKQPWLYP